MPPLCHRLRLRRRAGLSLIEVLTALAVFGVGATAILYSVSAAQRTGGRAHFLNEAVIRCKQVHGRLESGLVAEARPTQQSFADDSRWTWTTTEDPVVDSSLVRRTVTVAYRGTTGEQTYALTRIVTPNASRQYASDSDRGSR